MSDFQEKNIGSSKRKSMNKYKLYESTKEKEYDEMEIDESCMRAKDNQQSQINPFVIFHSPDDSEKSLFNKNKVINKEKKKKKKKKEKIIFTQQSEKSSEKMGMLYISKLQWAKRQKMTYISRKRTFIRLSYCQICKKLFQNHEAMGGHKRACKKKVNDSMLNKQK